MTDNAATGGQIVFAQFFYFLSAQSGFLCESSAKNVVQKNGSTPIFT
jgi:hypothetical protein